MLPPVVPASINRLLRSNSWARERLLPFAGKTVRFECPPAVLVLGITENGEVAAAAEAAQPAVTIACSPALMLRILARDETAWTSVRIEGDTAFAAAINHVWRNLRWDIEEDLSRVFGDVAAHRMAQTGRALGQWGRQSADNIARALAEYWTEEQPLIVDRFEVERFNREVDTLRDDVARLEKRLAQLAP